MQIRYDYRAIRAGLVPLYCHHCGEEAVKGQACDQCGQPVCQGKECFCTCYPEDAEALMARTQMWMRGIVVPFDLPLRMDQVRTADVGLMPIYVPIASLTNKQGVTVATHCESCLVVGVLEPYEAPTCLRCGNRRP